MNKLNYTIEELKVATLKRQLSNEVLEQLSDTSDIELLLGELEEIALDYILNEIAGSKYFYTLFDGISFLTGLDLVDQLHKHLTLENSFPKNYNETDEESEDNLIKEGWFNLNDVDDYLWSYRIDITLPKDFLDMLNIENKLMEISMSNLTDHFNWGIYINDINHGMYD